MNDLSVDLNYVIVQDSTFRDNNGFCTCPFLFFLLHFSDSPSPPSGPISIPVLLNAFFSQSISDRRFSMVLLSRCISASRWRQLSGPVSTQRLRLRFPEPFLPAGNLCRPDTVFRNDNTEHLFPRTVSMVVRIFSSGVIGLFLDAIDVLIFICV